MIELKCDVNIADKNGETALHLAAKNGQHKAAKTLLQHNADHSLVSFDVSCRYGDNFQLQVAKDGQTPLHFACQSGYFDVVVILLQFNALPGISFIFLHRNCNRFLDGTPFQDDKDAETLSSKSTAESVSEDLSDFVNRPIHLAAKSGNLEIIKELARYKANLNAINEQRQTALHISTAHSKFQVIITCSITFVLRNITFQATQQLLECGAIPDIIDYRNEAPIHLAAENGSNDISEVLLKFGTSVTLKDSKGIRLNFYINDSYLHS